MSFDFMQDAIESLDKSKDGYVLVYGRNGDKRTVVTTCLESVKDFNEVIKVISDERDRLIKKGKIN